MAPRKLTAPGRMYVVKLGEGDNVHDSLAGLAEAQGIDAALVIGIGGLSEAEVGYYSPEEGAYYVVKVEAPRGRVIEVASLTGNIVAVNGKPSVHLHVVLGLSPERTIAGHLVKGVVKPFMEIFVVEALGKPGGVLEVFDHRRGFKAEYREYRAPER